jgi:hypothetical protein
VPLVRDQAGRSHGVGSKEGEYEKQHLIWQSRGLAVVGHCLFHLSPAAGDKQQNLHDFLFFISLKTTVGLRENNQQPIKWQEIYVVISQLLLFERKEREAEQTNTIGNN